MVGYYLVEFLEKRTEEELKDYNPEQEAWDLYDHDPGLFNNPEPELLSNYLR